MLRRARALLALLPGTTLAGESSLYVTAPLGGPEQDDYLNQVVEVQTTLTPEELLAAVQNIENELQRERKVRWVRAPSMWISFGTMASRTPTPVSRSRTRAWNNVGSCWNRWPSWSQVSSFRPDGPWRRRWPVFWTKK